MDFSSCLPVIKEHHRRSRKCGRDYGLAPTARGWKENVAFDTRTMRSRYYDYNSLI